MPFWLALVISAIVYGILVGSYFGVAPPANSWLARLHVLDAEDQVLMMWLAIGIGATHLVYANLVIAWRHRKSLSALHALGWACIILGGFCAGLGKSYVHLAQLFSVGVGGLGLGALLVLLFTSKRPLGLAPKLLFGRLVDGLKGLCRPVQSLWRCAELPPTFCAGTGGDQARRGFQLLGRQRLRAQRRGVLLGLLVLVAGHAINFAMGIMGGVVHGLRLNLIEFFNWSLHEEGEQFRVFANKATE